VGNKKIREEKYELLKLELNEFKMKDDEGVEQMYSRMGCLFKVSMLSMLRTFPSRKSSGKSSKRSPSQDTCPPIFPKKTKCITICMPGSSFMHIVDISEQQKQYHVRKRGIIRVYA
jgi:hypothetical protein